MRRRDWMELALGSLAVGSLAGLAMSGVSASRVRADCALPEERASWLATNVHAGGDAYVWLGQATTVPTPSDLEVRMGGTSARLPIVWAVPGLARVRVPATASGLVQIVAPPRDTHAPAVTIDVTLAPGPPPARISVPPRELRTENVMRASGFSRGESLLVHFAPAPPTARHLLARWSSFGAHVALTADTVQAYVFVEGRCGTTPVYASPPRPGTRLEVAFLDDEGNASSFVSTQVPA